MRQESSHSRVSAASLSHGAQLFVFSARQWSSATRGQHCPVQVLSPFYARFSASEALPLIDELMAVLAVGAFRPIEINCPCKTDLSDDEWLLLRLLRALHRGDQAHAETCADTMLTGALRRTAIDIATRYVHALKDAALSVTGVRYLEPVQ